MSTRIKILLFVLIVWGTWGAIATFLLFIRIEESSLTQSSSESDVFYEEGGPFVTFPLACPSDLDVAEGPTWRTITIGESTILDLEEIYGVQVTREEHHTLQGDFAPTYSILLTPNASTERELAQSVDVCVVDGSIAVLSVTVSDDAALPGTWLADWIAMYGAPDIVTWTATGNSWRWRTLVWPFEGIALTVDAGTTFNDPTIGIVNSVTFFPIAQSPDYVSDWPFTGLNYQAPTSDSNGDLKEQNPFDFEGILTPGEVQGS